ncbi:MAG: glycosyltransferase, partial [Muribaculaceae bacterium]|nr:glycosyltransferase [Muribaculaceae bacterium]
DYVTADNDEERKSRFGMLRLIGLAIDGITGFTTAPLRFATVMGVLSSLAAFVYLIITLVKTLVWGDPVHGYPTIVCLILFLGGCQLLAIGIIGEYIGRIFSEVKKRPPYIVDSVNGEPYEKTLGSEKENR